MTRFRGLIVAAVVTLMAAPAVVQTAQTGQPAQLRITVIDQSGASIPMARVRVTPQPAQAGLPDPEAIEVVVDQRGQATLATLPIGVVRLEVASEGFTPHTAAVTIRRGNNNQTITLAVAGLQEEIVVSDAAAADTRGNASTTTLEEDEIAQLSDDPDELRLQLEAMTGGAGAVFQVNGFRGGRLPNRDEIRQIRFRTNSFAADNHDAGRVMVEIITRPGLTEWSGNANVGLRGPIVANRTSLRFNVDGNRSFDSATIVALRPDGRIADQVRRPFESTNVTVGLEHGFNASQTLRLEYRRGEDARTNLGVGDFNLMERAFARSSTDHQVRTSVHSILSRSAFNEFRFEWNGEESASSSVSGEPAIVVIDAFSSGGAGVASEGSTRTLELADNVDFTVGKHAMRAGMLLEAGGYRNLDARNAAGTFTFSSLEAFLAGTPNTYTQRLGQLRTSFSQYQLGVYWQDDFRLNRSLSLSVGVREELQSHVGDAFNVMPRVGFTYTGQRSRTTVRGGYGIFHDWYEATLHDQTLRVTGEAGAQRDLLILNPGYPEASGGVAATILGSGRVQADPDLLMPFVHQMSLGLERALTDTVNVQASYMLLRGRHQLRSRNVNAPDAFGVRPEPGIGTVTQIESTGRSATDRITMNAVYRMPAQRSFINVNYTWSNIRNHTDGALSLPADSYSPDAEWAPSSQDVRHRFNAMFNVMLPLDVRANIGGTAQSASPYTITTGRDDNRDGVSNDRPAGVGRNSARAAARYDINLRLSRGFGFGGSAEGAPGGPGGGGGGPVVVAGGPGGGGPGGGQGGPGGPGGGPGGGGPGGGPGGGLGGGANDDSRFRVEFYVQGFNILNRTNFGNFSGNLQSPFFGSPTSATQARRVEVGMQFRF